MQLSQADVHKKKLLLSLDRLWLVIAIALPVLVALLVPLPAVDLAYQVRAGDEILRRRAARRRHVDVHRGRAAVDGPAVAGPGAAGARRRVGGWELLAVLRAGWWRSPWAARSAPRWRAAQAADGGDPRAARVRARRAGARAPAAAVRDRDVRRAPVARRGARASIRAGCGAAPLLVVLWANIHGSFVLAPLVLGYAWLDDVARKRPWRPSLAVLVVGLLATFVKPFGPGVWAYAAGIGVNPAITDRVSEWQRTTPLTVPGALFYASAIGTLL